MNIPVICDKHGKVTSFFVGLSADGLQQSFAFCGLCFGEWMTKNFPVRLVVMEKQNATP